MLPKYLLADNSIEREGRLFVLHTEHPRFILEGNDDDFSQEQTIHWLDEEITDEKEINSLISGAEEFLDKELDNQEELYDVSMN